MDKKDVSKIKKGLTPSKCSINKISAYYMTAGKKGDIHKSRFLLPA